MDIKKARDELRKGKTIYDMPLKVAYYARVSTDKDDQLNSLENQQKYFEELIKENKNWIFCGGYIDEGISGTAVKNRNQFLNMIECASLGKIDLILTKEISRFSRNTVDSIKYTEYLLRNGVIVYFLSDNLNTIQEDSEFRLTIMSSLAQDEVRKLSERVKFGVNRMIKDRKLIGGNLTGYYKNKGKYIINPKEEPIITYLFETYVSSKVGLKKIGEDLAKMGYLNTKGKPYSQTTLAKMLTNPRYKGYYTARLTEIEDYKTHKKKRIPKEKQIIEKDERIPAIINEELWNKANGLYEKRKKARARHILNSDVSLKKSKYSCLIYCKDCNCIFIRTAGSNRKNNPSWVCKRYKTEGVSACESPIIKEKKLDRIFTDIFYDIFRSKREYLSVILKEYENAILNSNNSSNINSINDKISNLNCQKDKLLSLLLKDIINDEEFKCKNDKLNREIKDLEIKLNETINKEENKTVFENIRKTITEKMNIKNQLPNLMKTFIDKIEIEKCNNDRKNVIIKVFFNYKENVIIKRIKL